VKRKGVAFHPEGSLENPEFNYSGSLAERFTIGLAKSLGLSVIGAGETTIIQGGRAYGTSGRSCRNFSNSFCRLR